MFTSLEDLPNELILEIFDYVKIRDLSYGFWNLNERLNQLIRSLKYLSLILTKNETYESILFTQQITRIVIVTITDIQLKPFVNLRSLTLNLADEHHLQQIRSAIVPNLVYLSIPISFDCQLTKHLASEVFSNRFPALYHVDLRIVNLPDLLSWSISPSLRSIDIFSLNINIIPLILHSCPRLTHLQIRITDEHEFDLSSLPRISNHPLKYFRFFQSQTSTYVFDIAKIISLIPNIKRIDLHLCTRSLIDLIKLIADSFPSLIRFDCHIIEYPNKDKPIAIHQLRAMHPCYSNIQCTLREDCFCLYTTKQKKKNENDMLHLKC